MQKSHDPRRDLIDTCAASEHLFDAEAHIAQSHCAAVNRDLPAALKWLVWAVEGGTTPATKHSEGPRLESALCVFHLTGGAL